MGTGTTGGTGGTRVEGRRGLRAPRACPRRILPVHTPARWHPRIAHPSPCYDHHRPAHPIRLPVWLFPAARCCLCVVPAPQPACPCPPPLGTAGTCRWAAPSYPSPVWRFPPRSSCVRTPPHSPRRLHMPLDSSHSRGSSSLTLTKGTSGVEWADEILAGSQESTFSSHDLV